MRNVTISRDGNMLTIQFEGSLAQAARILDILLAEDATEHLPPSPSPLNPQKWDGHGHYMPPRPDEDRPERLKK